MRVLIGCDTFSPDVNGAARFAERLAAGLVSRGHDVHVVAPASSRRTAGTSVEIIEGQPMVVHRWPSWRWYPHDWLRFVLPWTARGRARRVLDEFSPDVIHIQSHIVVGRGLAIEGSERGIRIVATNHVMPENILDFTLLPQAWMDAFLRWAWAAANRVFALCSAVTTPTPKAAEFLERGSGLRGVIPVSCGIDASVYRPELGPREVNRVLYVGRLTSEKNIDVLIRAMALLDPALQARLEIVGGGDQAANLERLVGELSLRDTIAFAGRISDDDLVAVYSQASVLAMPSIAELQSIVTMEAMASGLPVVGADAMALPHLVRDGENGYLFTPGDAADLAEKLTRVLTAPADEYVRMQRASLEGVRIHDINRTLDTFEALYRDEPIPR